MHRIEVDVASGEVKQIPLTDEEEAEREYLIANPPAPSESELVALIIGLQQKAVRALVEDAPDTTWLDIYKAQIAALRSQIEALK